jgi:hypothetical protein
VKVLRGLVDVEQRTVVLGGKQPPASDDVDHRPAVAAWDVHACLTALRPVPFDGDAMRGILAAQPKLARYPSGP